MKIFSLNKTLMVLFLLYFLSNVKQISCTSTKSYSIIIKNLEFQLDFFKNSLDNRTKEILKYQAEIIDPIPKAIIKFEGVKLVLNQANKLLQSMFDYIEDLKKEIKNNKILNRKFKNEEKNYNRQRIDSGLNSVNKVLVNIFKPNIIKDTLNSLYIQLSEMKKAQNNKTVPKFIETKVEKNGRINKSSTKLFPRAWSSWRIEEQIISMNTVSKNYGHKVMKACVTAFLNNVNPTICWKDEQNLGNLNIKCPNNYKTFGSSCLAKCKSGYDFFGGLCWKVCEIEKKLTECGSFCSKSSSCLKSNELVIKDFYVPEFLTPNNNLLNCSEGYYKSGLLCYKQCEQIGMVNCDLGTCATSHSMCNKTFPQTPINFIETYVAFFGYI
jgi:hypothetical protein